MKKYEAVFILDMRKVEDEGKAFSEELAGNIQSWGGNMVESISMGRKQFAREINKRKAGIYWNYIFEIDPLKVKEIRDKYRLDERMIRIMELRYLEERSGEEIAEEMWISESRMFKLHKAAVAALCSNEE